MSRCLFHLCCLTASQNYLNYKTKILQHNAHVIVSEIELMCLEYGTGLECVLDPGSSPGGDACFSHQ